MRSGRLGRSLLRLSSGTLMPICHGSPVRAGRFFGLSCVEYTGVITSADKIPACFSTLCQQFDFALFVDRFESDVKTP